MADVETIWDGEFIQHMPHDEAIAAQSAGLVQIFEGPYGYQPGFFMKNPSEFPFSNAFNPLNLFKPGDRGGFYNPNVISSLFQTRAGPTVPVTANNDPVAYIVDQNGQFDLSRTLAGRDFVYFDGLLGTPSSVGQLVNLTSGNIPGFEQLTLVMSGAISTDLPITANTDNALFLEADNTNAFGGATIRLDVRASPRIVLGTWVPPDQNPTASLNVPDTALVDGFVFGARLDTTSATQYMFFNDLESTPTIAYSPITAAASAAEFGGIGEEAASMVSIATFAFFIDRWLTDTELAELKQWILDNAGQPV